MSLYFTAPVGFLITYCYGFGKKLDSAKSTLVDLDDIKNAENYIFSTGLVRKTPLVPDYVLNNGQKVSLKMEHLQFTGSFKIRGMTNVFRVHEKKIKSQGAVTLSAGNAGRSFAFLCGQMNVKSTVCMPISVPPERVTIIQNLGSTVELMENKDLVNRVDQYVQEGRTLIHPFDDKDLIAGHGTLGLEIIRSNPNVDCILVCCGGGGLVAGVAAAVKLSGHKAKVFAVEPSGAACMKTSFDLNRPAVYGDFDLYTIAHGLAPPFAGTITYDHCKKFVDGILIVEDEDLVEATKYCFSQGLVVETSGCASLAAVMANKLPSKFKNIVCVLTGRNISTRELDDCFKGELKAH